MSGFAEVRKTPPVRDVSGEAALPHAGTSEDEASLVRYWRGLIERRKAAEDYKEWEKYKEEAKKYGKGDLLDNADITAWKAGSDDSPIVQVNIWRRVRSYYMDAVFSNNPNLAFRPQDGRSSPQTLKNAASVEAMVKYIWEECKQQPEARRALKDAWNCNVSVVKTDYDPARGLYRALWVAGSLIVDGECHGDLRRAMWVAEEMRIPAARILQNEVFEKEKRLELYAKWKGNAGTPEAGALDQLKTVHYVCSREGLDPLQSIKELAGEVEKQEGPRKILFAIVEGFDEVLFRAQDPYPYLNEDEFNYPVLCLEEEPGEWYGSPQWKMLKGLIDAINWLVSFHVAVMKKKATTVILVNESIWKDGATKLAGSACMEAHTVKGDPNLAAAKLDLGSGDMGQLQSAEALMAWLERISGFNKVAQGESGGRKTATEADSQQKNTSLVTKGASVSFDGFLNEMVRQVALASLYYIPAFSRVIGPDGMVMTHQAQEMPVAGPPDPMTGMPTQTKRTQPVPAAAPPEDASELGAVPFEMEGQDFGMRMPDTDVDMSSGAPVFTNKRAGTILKRGVDHFCGVEVAMGWPTQPLDDVKRDLLLTLEAGSTRADFRNDQQQAAMGAMQLLGPIYQQVGGLDALYELVLAYTQSLPLDNTGHLIPPREAFVSGMQQAMQAQQMAANPPAPPPPPPDPSKSEKVQGDHALKKEENEQKNALAIEKLSRELDAMEKQMKHEQDMREREVGVKERQAAAKERAPV